jgi:hypothetical protein
MPLTDILLIVLTIAAVVAVVFLVRLLIPLRRTAMEAERTLAEVRVLVQHLSVLNLEVKTQVEGLGETLSVFGKAAIGLSKAALLVTSRLLPAPARLLLYALPMARFVARQMKKKEEKDHVE